MYKLDTELVFEYLNEFGHDAKVNCGTYRGDAYYLKDDIVAWLDSYLADEKTDPAVPMEFEYEFGGKRYLDLIGIAEMAFVFDIPDVVEDIYDFGKESFIEMMALLANHPDNDLFAEWCENVYSSATQNRIDVYYLNMLTQCIIDEAQDEPYSESLN